MINLKRISGIIGISIAAFGFTGMAKADDAWTTLKNCLEQGESTVCTLTGDVTSNSDVTIKTTKELNLGGYTLTLEGNNRLILDVNESTSKGALTIKGNGGKIETATESTIVTVRKGTSLVVESGVTLTSTAPDNVSSIGIWGSNDTNTKTSVVIKEGAIINGNINVAASNDATYANGVTVDIAGTVNTTNSDAVSVDGRIKKDGTTDATVPKVIIRDTAEITSENGVALYGAGYADWTIEGGTITGREALGVKSGAYNIKGGIFTGTGEYDDDPEPNGSGSEPTGAAISITDTYASKNGKVKMNITGGEFYSANGVALFEFSTTSTAVEEFAVTGGYFEGAEGSAIINNATESVFKNKITGGSFADIVSEGLIKEGSKAEELDYTAIEKALANLQKVSKEIEDLDSVYTEDYKYNKAEEKVTNKINAIALKYDKFDFDKQPKTQAEIEEYANAMQGLADEMTLALQELQAAKNVVTLTVVVKDGDKVKETRDYEFDKKASLNDLKKAAKEDYDIVKFLDKDGKEITDLDKKYTEDTEVTVVLGSPETGDNILTFVGVGAISVLGLGFALKKRFTN